MLHNAHARTVTILSQCLNKGRLAIPAELCVMSVTRLTKDVAGQNWCSLLELHGRSMMGVGRSHMAIQKQGEIKYRFRSINRIGEGAAAYGGWDI